MPNNTPWPPEESLRIIPKRVNQHCCITQRTTAPTVSNPGRSMDSLLTRIQSRQDLPGLAAKGTTAPSTSCPALPPDPAQPCTWHTSHSLPYSCAKRATSLSTSSSIAGVSLAGTLGYPLHAVIDELCYKSNYSCCYILGTVVLPEGCGTTPGLTSP